MTLFYFYVLMHALPGIVDGARKTSQVGTEAKGGSGRLSSLPMHEATSSRDQRISAVTSVMQCGRVLLATRLFVE